MRKMIQINKGDIFGRLSIIKEQIPIHSKFNKMIRVFECMCECGHVTNVRLSNLRNNSIKSCGCLQKDIVSKSSSKHRQAVDNRRTSEYMCWSNIKQRCTNPKSTSWKYYGKRGIKMCNRWYISFKHFYEDMGEKPEKNYNIERINNDGNYEPNNCKWATKREQSLNRKKRTLIKKEKYAS